MPVTLRDVARRAGVSSASVSRAFTPGASISPRTRSRVERAASELGYFPNALASSLTTGLTKLIGLVSNDFHNPFFLEVFDRLSRGLQRRGLRPLLVNLTDETDSASAVRMLRQYSVDGVIVASSTLSPGFAGAFHAAGLPVVHAFGCRAATPGAHVVGIDDVECGRMAVRTLAARGYRRIAFLGGPESATSTQDRLAGFREEASRSPSVQASCSFAAAYSFEAGRAEMVRLLSGGAADAYFCGDDVLSIGAINALRDSGRRVPEDAGVLGVNDMAMASWEGIDLTTIRQPVAEIAEASIDLMAKARPAAEPSSRLFPCQIVERGTLQPLP